MISRRQILRGVAAAAGAGLASRLAPGLVPVARGSLRPGATSARVAFLHMGGCISNNNFYPTVMLGNRGFGEDAIGTLPDGTTVSKNFLSALDPRALSRTAIIAVRHRPDLGNNHEWGMVGIVAPDQTKNRFLELASLIPSTGPAKVVAASHRLRGFAKLPWDAMNGVAAEPLTTCQPWIDLLKGASNGPDRKIKAAAFTRSRAIGRPLFVANPHSLQTFDKGLVTAAASLAEPGFVSVAPEAVPAAYETTATSEHINNAPQGPWFAMTKLAWDAGVPASIAGNDTLFDDHSTDLGQAVDAPNASVFKYLRQFTKDMFNAYEQDPSIPRLLVLAGEFWNSRFADGGHANDTWVVLIGTEVVGGRLGTVECRPETGDYVILPEASESANYDQLWALISKSAGVTDHPWGALPANIAKFAQ